MKIIKPYFVIEEEIDKVNILKRIEKAGRTAYKSEDKITEKSAPEFVKKMMNFKHVSVIEHSQLSFRFITDRGITHEIVRSRLFSYTQESTRYCNFSKNKFGNEITVIEPLFFEKGTVKYNLWLESMLFAEKTYLELLKKKATPQEARSVLPNSLKTEIVVTGNIRLWRTFLTLRCNKASHPQMRELTLPLLIYLNRELPELFGDLHEKFISINI